MTGAIGSEVKAVKESLERGTSKFDVDIYAEDHAENL